MPINPCCFVVLGRKKTCRYQRWYQGMPPDPEKGMLLEWINTTVLPRKVNDFMLTHWYRSEIHHWNKYYDAASVCIIPLTKGSQIVPCRLIQPAQEDKMQLHCLQLLSWVNYSYVLMWLYCSWHPNELPQLCPASHILKRAWISESSAQSQPDTQNVTAAQFSMGLNSFKQGATCSRNG